MLYNETYRKYFDKNGLKNIFLPIQEIANSETQCWIVKSIDEINRFSNYIILINKYEKEPIDNFTLSAIHESLATSSISIAFSIYNIFALITGTEASFFDDHIKDYFKSETKLNSEEMYLLSLKWQTPIHSINSLSYSIDEKLCVYKCDALISFRILNYKETSLDTRKRNGKMIYSKEFFIIHLFYILSTVDLIASLLSEKSVKLKLKGTLPRNNYIEIENIIDFMSISKDILPGL
jgi:hypothetical protein